MKRIASIFLIFWIGTVNAQIKTSDWLIESVYEFMQFELIGKQFLIEANKQANLALSVSTSGLSKGQGVCILSQLQNKDAVLLVWKTAITSLLANQPDLIKIQEIASTIVTNEYYLAEAENLVLQLSHAPQEKFKQQHLKIMALIYQNKAYYERVDLYEKQNPSMNVMTIARTLALPAIGTKQAADKVSQQLINTCKQK